MSIFDYNSPDAQAFAALAAQAGQMAMPTRTPTPAAAVIGQSLAAMMQGGQNANFNNTKLQDEQLKNYAAGNQALIQQNAMQSFGLPTYGPVPGAPQSQPQPQNQSAPALAASPSGPTQQPPIQANLLPQNGQALPRGIRNNNPGNISQTSNPWAGEIQGQDPTYKTFSTPEAGLAAQAKNLLSYGSQGVNTLSGIANKWAPASGGNNPTSYAQNLALRTGIKPSQPIDFTNDNQVAALMKAQITQENGQNPYNDQQIGQAIQAARGNQQTQQLPPIPQGQSPTQQPAGPQTSPQSPLGGNNIFKNNMMAGALGMKAPDGYMYDFQHGGVTPLPGGPFDPAVLARNEGAKANAQESAKAQFEPMQITTPDGKSIYVNKAQLAQNPVQVASPADTKRIEAEGTATGEQAKTLNIMQANLPIAIKRFQEMRDASRDANYGPGTTNENDGLKQEISKALNNNTAVANTTLFQKEAQGILPELGPQLAQAGVKGNKFLEGIANSASGVSLTDPPQARAKAIDGLETQYIRNMKAASAELRSHGQQAPSDDDIDAMVQHYKQSNGFSTGAVNSTAHSQADLLAEAQRRGLIK